MTGELAHDILSPSEAVNVLGLDTHYRRRGRGEPLLYLGGQGYSGRWIPLHGILERRFDTIVPDHPSFGETDIPDILVDFDDLAIHYATFLDELGVGAVHLVGHGFGGWIAAEFAAIFPERVLSLTLIAPTGTLPDADEKMFDPYRVNREQWLDLALGESREQWSSVVDAQPDPADRILTDYRERIGVARVAWNPRYSLRMEHRLARVSVPSQVLIPERDPLIAPSVARRYTELLRTSPPVVIAGESAPTQHLVVIQEPERVADAIVRLALADTTTGGGAERVPATAHA